MEAFEAEGLWWLPDKPEEAVVGILRFDPVNGAVLDVLGDDLAVRNALKKKLYNDTEIAGWKILQDFETVNIVCGNIIDGRPVTLYRCHRRQVTRATGYMSSSFIVEMAFVGCHFATEDALIFDSVSVNYSGLEQWLGITGFSQHREGYTLKYEQPPRIEFRVNDLRIGLYHILTGKAERFVYSDIRQTSYIEISPDIPLRFYDYQQKAIYQFRNFLCFATGAPVVPRTIEARTQHCAVNDPRGIHTVSVYFAVRGAELNKNGKIDKLSMLFSYADIADNLGQYIQRWFAKAEILRPVIDLYVATFYVPEMYVDLQLLTLIQALETYHRRIHDGVYMPADQFEPVRQKLVAALPGDIERHFRDHVERQFGYLNQYSLRKRLQLILNNVLAPYPDIVNTLVSDQKTFIDQVVNTRNYLTHYPDDLETKAITDPRQQYDLVQRIKWLLILCFLTELGMTPQTVDRIVKNNWNFRDITGNISPEQ